MRAFPPFRSLNAPNAVTTIAALSGVTAIALAHEGRTREALTAVVVAIVCDRLDGVLARRLRQQSELGRELDSLADAISFGVAPAAIAWFSNSSGGALAAIPLAAWVVAAIWRLAHYNVTGLSGSGSDERFTGLPTTFAAGYFVIASATLHFLHSTSRAAEEPSRVFLLSFFGVGAILMVSALPVKKRGVLMKSLYVLLPLALVALWSR